MLRNPLIILVGVALISARIAHGDNGAVAHAYFVDEVSIDGDFSDWPDSGLAYPIEIDAGSPLRDFQASFRVAYNDIAGDLYVAVCVQDSDPVKDKGGGALIESAQDTHVLFVDVDHHQRGSGPLTFLATDKQHRQNAYASGWDPKMNSPGKVSVETAVAFEDGVTTYEWRLHFGPDIRRGSSIGLDHVVIDVDQVGEEQYALWGPFLPKDGRSARLGDVVLVDPDRAMGTVTGQISWASGVQGRELGGSRVRIVASDGRPFWVQVKTDESGAYKALVPVGQYEVRSPFPLYKSLSDLDGNTPYDLRIPDDLHVKVTAVENQVAQAPQFEWVTEPFPTLPDLGNVLVGYEPDMKADLENSIEKLRDFYAIPGASIALVIDGEVAYTGSFGVRNAYTQEPVIDTTLFEAGSVTKIGFAFIVNRMAERGEIDLDRPLHEYLPFNDAAHDEKHRLITAKHVLSHTTGLPNWPWMSDTGRLDIKFLPGTDFSYSGAAFEYLGRAVAHLQERPLEEILKDEFQTPMGQIENTLFYDDGTLFDRVAFGHDLTRPNVPHMPSEIGVAYSMQTNAAALANFMAALSLGEVLSEEGYEQMFTPLIEANYDDAGMGWNVEYGLGFKLMSTPHGRVIGHTGLNGSNNAIFEYYEDYGSGFVALTNSDAGREFYFALRRYLLGEEGQ